ncbi:MAG: conjugal transfer protein TrbF [Proteobacteria bacterium]|nr:conjugal transfer protein TrbF [Pseudomonadota bacterium]
MQLFRRPVQRYGLTPEPATPYQRAGQLWDERLGSARVQAHNWRLMAFGCLTLAVGLAGGVLWLGMQSRVVPYVVEVDREGQVHAVGPAITPYNPTDAQIAFHISRFITDLRSLSIDPVVVRRNWLEAYDYVTERAGALLSDYARANDPFKSIGERSISVQVTSVVRVSDQSFQVKWTEQAYEHESLASTERWTAILTIVVQPPRSAETVRKNPLGIYVNGLSWSRELNPGEAP